MAGVTSVIIRIGAETADAVAGIERVNKAAGDAQTTGQKWQAGIAKAAIPAAAAMTALTAIAVKSAKAAAQDQASREALDGQIRRSTASTNDQIAANEKWIDSVSGSVAVAQNELRPALAGLVRTTGDLTSAHKLLRTALDTSAATGKPLASVTAALSRAYGGSYGALTKLDPALRSVAVSGARFADVQAALNQQVAGAAKGEAETAAGQYKSMQIAIHGLEVAIGDALLPALQAVLPVVTQFFAVAAGHTSAIVALGVAFATVSSIILAANVAIKAYRIGVIAWSAAVKVAAVVSRAWTAITIALNVAIASNPVGAMVVAVIALGVAIVIAYRHSATFRGIVQAGFRAVADAANYVKDAVVGIAAAIGRVLSAAGGLRGALLGVLHAIGAAIEAVISAVERLISAIGHIHLPSFPHFPGTNVAGSAYAGAAGAAAYSGSASPYGAAPVYNITVNGAIDPDATALAIRRSLERYDRRRGRGYASVQPWTPRPA